MLNIYLKENARHLTLKNAERFMHKKRLSMHDI